MSDIVERLRNWCTDWNGAQMVRGEPPRDGLHCDDLLDAVAEIECLRARFAAPANALERAAAAWVLLSRWENIAKNGGERWLREHPLVKTTSELLSEEAALARSEEKGHG